MKIITLIKQVPDTSEVNVDPDTGSLIREGNNVKMNPFDLFGIETSMQIQKMHKDVEVVSLTMGPPSAVKVLEESLSMGCSDAYLVTDRRFAGADVLATSYTLSQVIKSIKEYDIVICGKQTTDGDTAQVGPEVAEFLGIPHVPYVKDVVKVSDESILVTTSYEDYDQVLEVKLPCLLTVDKDIYVPRLPSYLRKKQFENHKIKILTLSDLEDKNPENYGLSGSPTQVVEMFPPVKTKESVMIEGTAKEVSDGIINVLVESKFL